VNSYFFLKDKYNKRKFHKEFKTKVVEMHVPEAVLYHCCGNVAFSRVHVKLMQIIKIIIKQFVKRKPTEERSRTRGHRVAHTAESQREVDFGDFSGRLWRRLLPSSENGRIFKDGRPETSHSFLVVQPKAPDHCFNVVAAPDVDRHHVVDQSVGLVADGRDTWTVQHAASYQITAGQSKKTKQKKNKVRRKEKESKRREKPFATRSGADRRIGSNDSQYARWIDVERPV
jgi:hypothetical protein